MSLLSQPPNQSTRYFRETAARRLSVLVNCEFSARWIADIFISDLPHKMLASFLCD